MPYAAKKMVVSRDKKIFLEMYTKKNELWSNIETTIGDVCKEIDGYLYVDKDRIPNKDKLLKVVLSDENFNSIATVKIKNIKTKPRPLTYRNTQLRLVYDA